MPPETNRISPDRAPTPFSAAEIAAACAPGRVNVYRIEEAGSPPVVMRWEFVDGDAGSGESRYQTFGEDGTPLGDPQTARARWTDLQGHASYPEALTTITHDVVEVPGGRFDCWRYTIDDGDEQTEAWCAGDLPGPPVLKIHRDADRELSRMTLLEVIRSAG